MTLESRPQLRYARIENAAIQTATGHAGDHLGPSDALHAAPGEQTLAKALELARQLEELLEDTRSVALSGSGIEEARSHSTRMARAMAASLVDELQAIVRPARTSGVA